MAEIKYKETTISAEAGQIVILNTIDRKLTGDIKVITPKTETIEEWDRSYTISGGVELIGFTIDGDHYETEDGMTWREWCDSSYNTGGWAIDNDFIWNSAETVTYNGVEVTPTDVIIEAAYGVVPYHGGSN